MACVSCARCRTSVYAIDEARAVLERLRRIELLDREGASPPHLLAEVRALLTEAEAWVRAERGGTEEAEDALERCRMALERRPFAAVLKS